MKIGKTVAWVVLSGGLFFSGLPADADDTLYVQSRTADLRTGPGFQHAAIASLKRGDAVVVVERKGDWYHVSHNGSSGYLYRLGLAARPAAAESTVFSDDAPSIRPMARRRASGMTSAAAARGLTGEGTDGLKEMSQAEYEKIEKLENLSESILDDEIERFRKTDP